MKCRMLCLSFLSFFIMPGAAMALSGKQACHELERRLMANVSIDADCSYISSAEGNGYAVGVNRTSDSRKATLGMIMAGILGADEYVPTRSVGVAVSFGDDTYVWKMPNIRLCKKHIGVDGSAFEKCVLNTSTKHGP